MAYTAAVRAGFLQPLETGFETFTVSFGGVGSRSQAYENWPSVKFDGYSLRDVSGEVANAWNASKAVSWALASEQQPLRKCLFVSRTGHGQGCLVWWWFTASRAERGEPVVVLMKPQKPRSGAAAGVREHLPSQPRTSIRPRRACPSCKYYVSAKRLVA